MSQEQVSSAALRAAELNGQTRGLCTYGGHREKVMQLIGLAAERIPNPTEASIAVLGAGNCLDLDLRILASRFRRIELVDIDRSALEFALTSQGMHNLGETGQSTIQLLAPFDFAQPLIELRPGDFREPQLWAKVCESLQASLPSLPCAPCDVVVSACLLSQLISPLVNLTTEQHPNFAAFLQALRRGHFLRMLQLLKPGGQAIFISDLVSSETTPVLHQVTDADLPRLLAHCLSAGNFFSGLNPGLVLQDLQTQPPLNALAHHVQILAPWRWQMGPRTYAVYAITFTKQ